MGMAEDFNDFWARYPRRIGKLAALAAYQKARKSGVTQQQLLDGIGRYVANKPAYADWAHPKTWLSQGRYLDEYDAPAVTPVDDIRSWCQHSRGCPNRAYHDVLIDMEQRDKVKA